MKKKKPDGKKKKLCDLKKTGSSACFHASTHSLGNNLLHTSNVPGTLLSSPEAAVDSYGSRRASSFMKMMDAVLDAIGVKKNLQKHKV